MDQGWRQNLKQCLPVPVRPDECPSIRGGRSTAELRAVPEWSRPSQMFGQITSFRTRTKHWQGQSGPWWPNKTVLVHLGLPPTILGAHLAQSMRSKGDGKQRTVKKHLLSYDTL